MVGIIVKSFADVYIIPAISSDWIRGSQKPKQPRMSKIKQRNYNFFYTILAKCQFNRVVRRRVQKDEFEK